MKRSLIVAISIILSCSVYSQFQDDFTTYATQAAADAAWPTSNTSNARVNITSDKIDHTFIQGAGGPSAFNHSISHDLGAGNVSDVNWVLRFSFRYSARVAGVNCFIGIGDSDHNVGANSNQDFIGMDVVFGGGYDDIVVSGRDNQTITNTPNGIGTTINPAVNTTYYMEVTRQSATSVKVEAFSDTYATSIGQHTLTIPSTIQSLRYLKICNKQQAALEGNKTATIGCIQFCNGTTTFNCGNTISCGGALPVELLSFSAKWQDDSHQAALIEWETTNEINNDYFEIERSIDAVNFETIARVEATNNPAEINKYERIDDDPVTDRPSYYRLRQVDFNGDESYSNIDVLNVREGLEIINLYPNPVDAMLQFAVISSSSEKATIKVINSVGQSVYSQSTDITAGFNNLNFDLSNIAEGNYFIHIELATSKYHAQRKLIVNRQNN